MHRLEVMGFAVTEDGGGPLLLLRAEDGGRLLPIGIGGAELLAITTCLEGARPERPLTHDLLATLIQGMGAEVTQVAITELRDEAFRAAISLETAAGPVDVDARPSDAIALAVRTDAPIFASDQVMEDASVDLGLEDSDATVERFRAFLEDVSPDDFGAHEGPGRAPGA